MEFNVVLQAISTIGFPIVAACVCGWYITKKDAQHKDETQSFVEALNKNTLVLQKLCDKMDVEREDE